MALRRMSAVVALSGLLALPLEAQSVDTAGMRAAAREFLAGCSGGVALWKQTLCGPMILVDPSNRFAVATKKPAEGEFVAAQGLFQGTLPDGLLLANTAQEWVGERWSFVLAPLPTDDFVRRGLLFHEAFHRIQPALGLDGRDRLNAHLDQRDGRYWLRLELRALSAAVLASGAKAKTAAGDAVLFRTVRQQEFPGADTLEAALEKVEGIPEYTGARLALAGRPGDVAIANGYTAFEQRPSYARALGYGTGPMLGVLLDRYRPDWRTRVKSEGFAAQLPVALGWKAPADLAATARQRAALYEGDRIAKEEDARADRQRAVLDDYRARLYTGPVLLLASDKLNMNFNPNTLVPLGDLGTVYPTATFSAAWGTIEITEGGALLDRMYREVRVPVSGSAVLSGNRVTGKGWTLILENGWRLVPGARAGDFAVVEAP